jgi:hypothetical protein
MCLLPDIQRVGTPVGVWPGETLLQDQSPFDAVLDATAAELDELTRLLVPESIEVLRQATARETANTVARALEAEAKDALRALLEDPDEGAQGGASEAGLDAGEVDDEAEEDVAWRGSLEQALAQDIQRALDDETPPWLDMRANDLARTMAATWIGFGRNGMARADILGRILGGQGEEFRAPVDDLSRRFELSRSDAREYFFRVGRLLGQPNLSQTLTSSYARGLVQS